MTNEESFANRQGTTPGSAGGLPDARVDPMPRERAMPVALPMLTRSIAEEDTASRYLHDALLGGTGQAAATTGQERQAGARRTSVGYSPATGASAGHELPAAAIASVRDEQAAAKEHLGLVVAALEGGTLGEAANHLERARLRLLQLDDDLAMLRRYSRL